uniref:Protein xylosyltransferase n=1 Tax=Neobodo designis TaxID=312471 RepID=A0A7S1W6Q0_NEODS
MPKLRSSVVVVMLAVAGAAAAMWLLDASSPKGEADDRGAVGVRGTTDRAEVSHQPIGPTTRSLPPPATDAISTAAGNEVHQTSPEPPLAVSPPETRLPGQHGPTSRWDLSAANSVASRTPSVSCSGNAACLWNNETQALVPGARVTVPGLASPRGAAVHVPFFIAGAMDRGKLAPLTLALIRSLNATVGTFVLHVNNPVRGPALDGALPKSASGGWSKADLDRLLAAAGRVAMTVRVIVGWGAHEDTCAGQWNTALNAFYRDPASHTRGRDWFVLSAVDVTFNIGGLQRLVGHVRESTEPSEPFLWHPHYNRRGSKVHIPVWNVFIGNRALLSRAGRFDETFYPAYHEDFDYRARLRAAGVLETRVPWKVMRAMHPVESATRTSERTLPQCAVDCVARTINLGHKTYKDCLSKLEQGIGALATRRERMLDALDARPIDEGLRDLARQLLRAMGPAFTTLCHPCVPPEGPRKWTAGDAPRWVAHQEPPNCTTVRWNLEAAGLLSPAATPRTAPPANGTVDT